MVGPTVSYITHLAGWSRIFRPHIDLQMGVVRFELTQLIAKVLQTFVTLQLHRTPDYFVTLVHHHTS